MAAKAARAWKMHTDVRQDLFTEYLELTELAGWGSLVDTQPLTVGPDDCLIVVDMQNDFIPVDPDNPRGGRFAVSEGNDIVPLVCRLMRAFGEAGASIIATRDYHPKGHCSFISSQGPFPDHCIQGSVGSHFYPGVGETLTELRRNGVRTEVAFKGYHEDVDSFGSFEYADTGESWARVSCRDCRERLHGCGLSAWTGCVLLDCSNLEADINAPPDVLAALRRQSLADLLRRFGTKRVFACGLAMDYCVMDTCLNGVQAGFKDMTLVMDAARSAHLPGVGGFGTGFLSDPSGLRDKLAASGVKIRPSSAIIRSLQVIDPFLARSPPKSLFPGTLGPYALVPARRLALRIQVDQLSYVALAPDETIRIFEEQGIKCEGRISTPSKVTLDRATCLKVGIPENAVKFCWAYPVKAGTFSERQMQYLPTTTASASFFVFGGFVYLGAKGEFLAARAMTLGNGLHFDPPWPIPQHVLGGMIQEAQEACASCGSRLEVNSNFCGSCGVFLFPDRWQAVTMPWLVEKGARWCSWWAPHESVPGRPGEGPVDLGGNHGGFVFLFDKDPRKHDARNSVYNVVDAVFSESAMVGRDEAGDMEQLIRALRKGGTLAEVEALFKNGRTLKEYEFVSGMMRANVGLEEVHLKLLFAAAKDTASDRISLPALLGMLLRSLPR